MVLKVTGRVEPSVRVEPDRVMLSGTAGEKIDALVKIIPETKEPFNVGGVSALRGTEIAYRIEPIDEGGKKAFALHVDNTKKEPGRYYDKIFVKTDSDVVNTITVIISGDIRPVEKSAQKPAK